MEISLEAQTVGVANHRAVRERSLSLTGATDPQVSAWWYLNDFSYFVLSVPEAKPCLWNLGPIR